ncbi:serine protease [Hymenobacter sp. UYP22]|uniref:S1 family peptidase n=1 Tax=Hymenobacter sp. UYP22 TaxID=3156348 RepID=UPI003395FC05
MSFSQTQQATGIVTATRSKHSEVLARISKGTAFFISSRHLLTAYHVVAEAEHLTVSFNRDSFLGVSEEFAVRCVEYDGGEDAAVLEVIGELPFQVQPLPLTTQILKPGDTWQTFGFPVGRQMGQTIRGQVLQYDGSPARTWVLGADGISPNAQLTGLSGGSCVHNGFVHGIARRQEAQTIVAVSIANIAVMLARVDIEVYPNPMAVGDRAIKNAIRVQEQPPYVDTNYTDRAEFGDLLNELNGSSFLLLSGDSFCGKSTLAKRLMYEFWDHGYSHLTTNDPQAARRFLSERPYSICLLEDPFGHNMLNEGYVDWRLVGEVCRDIQGNNKLLVTSKRDAVLQAAKAFKLEDCKIQGRAWRDLTVNDRSFLLELWEKIQNQDLSLDSDVVMKVRDHLERGDGDLLQPGHLAHLIHEDRERLSGKSFGQLRHLAMADARTLSAGFKERGDEFWMVAVCLALSCSTTKTVNEDDLKYILGQSEVSPDVSFIEENIMSITPLFGRHDQEEDPIRLPRYGNLPDLSKEAIAALRFFEDRSYVRNRRGSRQFAHPQYYEAATYAMEGLRRLDQVDDLLVYVRGSISCLNADAAYQCAEKLPYLYHILSDSDHRDKLITIAEAAFSQSIFFKVRTKALVFLLSIFPDLDSQVKRKVENRLRTDTLSTSSIFWDEGTPFLTEKLRFWWDTPEMDDAARSALSSKIENNEEVDDESTWQLLQSGASLSLRVIRHALNSNEGFIRSQAAIRFFSEYHRFERTERETTARIIFDDEYPSVVVEAIKAVFEFALRSADAHDSALFTDLIRNSLTSQFVVLRLQTFLMTFGIDYGSESMDWKRIVGHEKAAWSLWGEVFADFMNVCSTAQLRFTTGRYLSTLREAAPFVTPDQCLRISVSIWEWITRTLAVRGMDGYELSCLDFLLSACPTSKRLPQFQKFFTHQDTNLTCYNLRQALDSWGTLSLREQQVVIGLLQSQRDDVRWLKASAATYDGELPAQIQQVFYGAPDYLSQTAVEIVRQYPPEFLRDCLRMYCGSPGFLSAHGRMQSRVWFAIKMVILQDQLPGFDICVPDLLFNVVNGPDRDWAGWVSIWTKACNNASLRDGLLIQLIIQTGQSTVNTSYTKKLWTIICDAYAADESQKRFAKIVAEHMDILEHTGDPEDLVQIIAPKVWRDHILQEFPEDSLVLNFLVFLRLRETSFSIELTEAVNEIVKNLKGTPAKLYYTWFCGGRLIADIGIPELKLESLLPVYNRTLQIESSKLNEIERKEIESVENWVFTTDHEKYEHD